jgi:hypothetical protein
VWGTDVAANPTTGEHLIAYAKSGAGIAAVVVDRDGTVGPPIAVAPTGAAPAVAFDAALREYFVVWSDGGVIRGKRVSAGGASLGAGTSRVSDRVSAGSAPDVVARPGLGWFVVWQTAGPAARSDVVGQAVAPSGSDTGPDDFAISSHRNLAGLSQNAQPAVAYDPNRREALVAYSDRYEIYGQRVSSSNARLGGSIRLSSMGPAGERGYEAHVPSVAYHPRAGEYLVVWIGNDAEPVVAGGGEPKEAFGQHVSPTGAERGTDDFRLSTHPETDLYTGTDVVADPRSREYLATWLDSYHDHNGTEGTFARRVVAP